MALLIASPDMSDWDEAAAIPKLPATSSAVTPATKRARVLRNKFMCAPDGAAGDRGDRRWL
ncbi:hypothetical protein GCM10022242_12510 [Nocardioides panacisoli]|uniref:Uncharacterized protein n=1 Tax=Nocardioides panacisoli TaxID=627624 RepID=A0ABP7I7I7_9ACTN